MPDPVEKGKRRIPREPEFYDSPVKNEVIEFSPQGSAFVILRFLPLFERGCMALS
ncbi:hypothetical protein J2Y69_003102 [Microbacterium resistens]|uniref:Uncharacterized protein n=1 Tax=Microbacterium resistens TaxID=156977 RepID=A0ABU1SFV7_9MICO|nr:hypothetical protein [Microbacterium resistens]MDR6868483.1 hypothetical protein [Microbacterium resistens]